MAQFKIKHGRIKGAEGVWYGADGQLNDSGEQLPSVIELTDKEASLIDPDGTVLQTKAEWTKAEAGEKAKAAAIAKLEAEAAADAKKVGAK
jgi:hypothetical protein